MYSAGTHLPDDIHRHPAHTYRARVYSSHRPIVHRDAPKGRTSKTNAMPCQRAGYEKYNTQIPNQPDCRATHDSKIRDSHMMHTAVCKYY